MELNLSEESLPLTVHFTALTLIKDEQAGRKWKSFKLE